MVEGISSPIMPITAILAKKRKEGAPLSTAHSHASLPDFCSILSLPPELRVGGVCLCSQNCGLGAFVFAPRIGGWGRLSSPPELRVGGVCLCSQNCGLGAYKHP